MASRRLTVLGPPRLERDARPLELPLRRAMALLVYLAVTGRPQPREALAGLLWPESDEREARGRLCRTLHRLAETLGDDAILVGVRIPPARLHGLVTRRRVQFTQSGRPSDILTVFRTAQMGQARSMMTIGPTPFRVSLPGIRKSPASGR